MAARRLAAKIAVPRGPWQPFNNPADLMHDSQRRHATVFNALNCAGHVSAFSQSDLQLPRFYAY
jgi:hypothetical protein